MQLSLVRLLAALVGLFLLSDAEATPIRTINSSTRALGMGDAFTALASDDSALFYNPAGLAKVSGLNWKVFSLRAGGSGYEALTQIQDLNTSDSGFASAVSELYGEHVSLNLGGSSIFTAPMFGFGIYNHADVIIQVDNPVSPEINATAINDYGYVFGFGAPIGPFLQLGLDLKYIKRTGGEIPFGPGSLADLQSDAITQRITGWGVGYGADLGMNLVVPAPFFSATFAAVWRNVGVTRFRSEDPNTELPVEDNDITLGTALLFDFPLVSVAPAIDFRYLNRADLQLMRKINFGLEIGLPLIDIRGGFREGYYTAGVGVNLGLFKVDVATYGVELGEYPGQIEDRRYLLEFAMDLGVGSFSATGSSAKGGKGGSSSRSSSIWGSRRLKQRR